MSSYKIQDNKMSESDMSFFSWVCQEIFLSHFTCLVFSLLFVQSNICTFNNLKVSEKESFEIVSLITSYDHFLTDTFLWSSSIQVPNEILLAGKAR